MGQGIAKLWAGEPEKPDPVSGLTKRDINNIRRSWAPIWANSEGAGQEIFKRMFREDNGTKTIFKSFRNLDEEALSNSQQFKAHVIGFMASINMLVDHIHEPDIAVAMLRTFGSQHVKDKVPTKYFDIVDDVLLDYMAKDRKVNHATLDSWKRFITFMNPHIFQQLPGSG